MAKPNTTRRGFLGFMSALPVIGNSVSASITDPLTLTGIDPVGSTPMTAHYDGATSTSKKLSFFKKHGIPDWYKDELKNNSKGVRVFDPDIASNRSMSLVAKVRLQEKRQYERSLEYQTKGNMQYIFRQKMREKLGWGDW